MGDRIEILTNKASKPSRDWLNIVKTPSAKSKIRRYFAAATKDEDATAGRDILAKDLRKRGYGISTQRSAGAGRRGRADELQASGGPVRRHRRQ